MRTPAKRAASFSSKKPTSWCASNHPSLPRVAAYFEEQGRVYLVMEFIHGESLEKRLEQANAPSSKSQVLEWAIQICEVPDLPARAANPRSSFAT